MARCNSFEILVRCQGHGIFNVKSILIVSREIVGIPTIDGAKYQTDSDERGNKTQSSLCQGSFICSHHFTPV